MRSKEDTGGDGPSRRTAYSISQAAERTGLTAHTLRYYERDGLMLGEVDRSTTGHRRYTERDLGWITMITRLRATGMPIREVGRTPTCAATATATSRDRLDMLPGTGSGCSPSSPRCQDHLGAIDHKIGIYEDRLTGSAGG